jgi:hypothetical protein
MPEPIDPIPMNFLSVDDAVQRLAARISKRETGFLSFERTCHAPGDPGFAGPSANALHTWNQQSIACAEFEDAFRSGETEGCYLLDGSPDRIMKFERQDWWRCAFLREILRGGFVRAGVGEPIERADGRRVLIGEKAFAKLLRTRSSSRPAAVRKDCAEWLQDLMRTGAKKKSKAKHQAEAFQRFGISEREFRRIWRASIKKTESNWGRPGRPPNPA